MPSTEPVDPDEVTVYLDNAEIEATLKQHGWWEQFVAQRERMRRDRPSGLPWKWALVLKDGNELHAFIGHAGFPVPSDNGHTWLYLPNGDSVAGCNKMRQMLNDIFQDTLGFDLSSLQNNHVEPLN